MKVLQMIPEMESGGVERGTLELARHLGACGHESLVVSGGGKLVQALEACGTRHLPMPVGRKRLSSLLLVPKLRRPTFCTSARGSRHGSPSSRGAV